STRHTICSRDWSSDVCSADLMLRARPPHRAPGKAIFQTSDPDIAPVALMHNLKHNKVLHEKNVIPTVHTTDRPRVAEADRVRISSEERRVGNVGGTRGEAGET